MEPLFASVMERGFFLSEVHRENHVPQLKGVWVSLAYTRGFGSLGPKFKSWYAHQSIDALQGGQACVLSTNREAVRAMQRVSGWHRCRIRNL